MKKLLLLFTLLFSIHTISFASFPVTESEDSTIETVLTDSNNPEKEAVLNISESSNSLSTAVSGGGKGMSIAAMVCGIVGIFFAGIILGPLAIIFGALGMKRDGRGMAITGLVLGIIATVGALIIIAALSA
tara:strand:- start:128 stop:520 length:393 start_codon:yes stop_codon:yes gene_type:complete